MSRLTRTGLAWATIVFLIGIVLFGVVLFSHIPKWPIYVSILLWWTFFVYTTVHVNHRTEAAPISIEVENVDRRSVTVLR
jgi:hypothetical protein